MAYITFERYQKPQKIGISNKIKRAIKALRPKDTVILDGLSSKEVYLIVKKYHRRFYCDLQGKRVFPWKDSIITRGNLSEGPNWWIDQFGNTNYYTLCEDQKKHIWGIVSLPYDCYYLKLTRKTFLQGDVKVPRKLSKVY